MLEHTYIYPICLRYFGLLGSMPHCSLLILILIYTLSSKRAKWNCHLSFHNLRDQLLPSIYPWLQNRCLAINNSSLLVSAGESCTRCMATARLEHTYFLRYFGPFVRMPHNVHTSKNTHVFECNVVSAFQSNRWRTFGDLRFCTNEYLHFYLYRLWR
jgi:hypothetical protein